MKLDHDWFPAEIPPNVILGEHSWIYSSYAFVHFRSRKEGAVVVGSHSGIYNGTFFDVGEEGCVSVGDYSTLVGPKISTNSSVQIGNYCLIAHAVVIADHPYALPPAARRIKDVRAEIKIDDNVWIGAAAIILGNVHIGANAIIAARACVRSDVPANCIVAGNPARVVGFVSGGE
jgi:acetyltransferase-like isoleucine patch superfamily enzyme